MPSYIKGFIFTIIGLAVIVFGVIPAFYLFDNGIAQILSWGDYLDFLTVFAGTSILVASLLVCDLQEGIGGQAIAFLGLVMHC